MQKYSILMILAGLAVGLFLGFNPTTHRDLVRWWDSTSASQRQAQATPAPFSLSLRQFDSKVARLFRASSNSQTTARSRPPTQSLWSQIVAAVQSLWHALQRIWLSILAKFPAPKS